MEWKIYIFIEIDIRFYWVCDRIGHNNFHVLWGKGRKNLGDYVTKRHPVWHHRTMQPRNLKPTKKKKTQKTAKMELEDSVLELGIPG